MRPHSNNFNRFDVVKNLINETMLYADSSGIRTSEVTDEFFKKRWILDKGLVEGCPVSARPWVLGRTSLSIFASF